MAIILEFREAFKRFYNKYDSFIVPSVKFIVALISFIMINASIGYMDKLKNPLIVVVISALCAFLPGWVTMVLLSLFMLGHLYAISAEFALLALCIVLLMYLLYFRFTPKLAYVLIVTAMLCWMRIPYFIPIAMGLCSSALAAIPVGFGVIMYYIIRTASEYETAISNQSLTESMQQISFLIDSLIKNKQMIMLIVALAVTIVVVYVIRRLKIDHAWTYAIIVGSIVEFVVLVVGQIALKTNFNIVGMLFGIIFGAAVGYICNILFFSLDYKRTEYVQYEDDEYYYFVKAIPKINVVNEDVKVKQINARKTKRTSDINDVRKSVKQQERRTKAVSATEEDEDDFFFFENDD